MIPTYEDLMLPLLRLVAHAGDAGVRTREAVQQLGDELALTDEERTELLPSGRQAVFANRVGWAATYLKKAKLIGSPKRGVYQLSRRGADYLATGPATLRYADLTEFEEFRAFRERGREPAIPDAEPGRRRQSPSPTPGRHVNESKRLPRPSSDNSPMSCSTRCSRHLPSSSNVSSSTCFLPWATAAPIAKPAGRWASPTTVGSTG